MNLFKYFAVALLSLSLTACSNKADLIVANITSDLNKHFTQQLEKPVDVEVELLRDYPMIAGVSSPKFYAWIKVVHQGDVISQGAVRVAERSKKQYDLTHYLNKEDILQAQSKVSALFPKPLVEKILNKAQG